jgi:toxin CcdB
MAQFHAYQNANPATRLQFPYLLDIQSDLLDQLRTVVVIPLSPLDAVAHMTMSTLNPVISISENAYAAMTQEMASIDRSRLGQEVCDLNQFRSEIVAAVDFMLSGI